jgi:RNA polymerase sigma factor for flagellar operon FliA
MVTVFPDRPKAIDEPAARSRREPSTAGKNDGAVRSPRVHAAPDNPPQPRALSGIIRAPLTRMASAQASPARSVEDLFLSELATIERIVGWVCARHHVSATDADDIASHVKLRIIEDDYALLRKFQGRSSLRTYLTIVIERLFLDYRITAWGKWRPSAEARRCGEVGMLLERLLMRDGYTLDEAHEQMQTNHGVAIGRADLERLATRLPQRSPRRLQGEEALGGVPSRDRPADALLVDEERESAAERVSTTLRQVLEGFDTQDRLILTMRFEDERTVAAIASALRLEQKPLYRRIERLARELRHRLEAAGIDADVVREILESPAVTIGVPPAGEKRT